MNEERKGDVLFGGCVLVVLFFVFAILGGFTVALWRWALS